MPNLYASLADLKGGMPDGIRQSTTKYDSLLLRLAEEVSRGVDDWCNRRFFPLSETRYVDGSGSPVLRLPDLMSVTSVAYSDDDGQTYTALTATDYYARAGADYNAPGAYDRLVVNVNSPTLSYWPTGQRSIRVAGVWACTDDRAAAWQSTGDTVEDNPLGSGATTLTVNDVDGADLYGAVRGRFAAGQLLRIESEYVEVVPPLDDTANTLTIVRGRNGTTAAAHLQNVAIDVWRAPAGLRRAVVIQVNRELERGLQGYADSRATPELGQMTWSRQWDPSALAYMSHYRDRVFA